MRDTLRAVRAGARRHFTSAGWGALEYLFYPLLMVGAAPVFVSALGTEQFGLLALVTAVSSLGGAASLGMGAATVRFVASRLARGDERGAAEIVRATLAVGLAGSGVCAALLAFAAPALAAGVFPKMGPPATVGFTLLCGAAMLVLAHADGVFSAALKGRERYALTAKLEIVLRLLIVGGGLAAAGATRSLAAVLITTLVLNAINVVVKAITASALFGVNVSMPAWPSRAIRQELMGFGLWTWMQSMAAMLFAHLDRLLVGAFLGAADLGYYTVCMQLAQQVHAIPAATMSFLFPYFTRRLQQPGATGTGRARDWGVLANLALSLTLGAAMLAFGDRVLAAWMGPEFARASESILHWLTLAFFLLSVNVAPYYLLLARAEVRYLSLTTLAGSGLGLAIAWALMPLIGLAGAAFARVALGTATLLFYWKLYRPEGTR